MGFLDEQFRGWVKPGPIPPGAQGAGPEAEPGESLDAISGFFRLFQLKNGHRFSTDDVLTAWYGTSWASAARTVLDLGSGIGSVGMIAAWRLPGARFVTVEAQEDSVRLARKSAKWNGLEERYDIRMGDFRESGALAADERFDLVLGSPPYFPQGSGPEGNHPQKIACRFELRGTVADYCAIAVRHLAPGGLFACVFPCRPANLDPVALPSPKGSSGPPKTDRPMKNANKQQSALSAHFVFASRAPYLATASVQSLGAVGTNEPIFLRKDVSL